MIMERRRRSRRTVVYLVGDEGDDIGLVKWGLLIKWGLNDAELCDTTLTIQRKKKRKKSEAKQARLAPQRSAGLWSILCFFKYDPVPAPNQVSDPCFLYNSMEMKSKIYKRWDSILGDFWPICSTEITTKFRKNWKNGQKSADHRRVHGP